MQPLVCCKMLCYFSQHIPRTIPIHHLFFPKEELQVLDFSFWWIQHSADIPKKFGQVLTEMARLTQKRQGPLHVHCCQFMGEPAGSANMHTRLRFHCMCDARPVSVLRHLPWSSIHPPHQTGYLLSRKPAAPDKSSDVWQCCCLLPGVNGSRSRP